MYMYSKLLWIKASAKCIHVNIYTYILHISLHTAFTENYPLAFGILLEIYVLLYGMLYAICKI